MGNSPKESVGQVFALLGPPRSGSSAIMRGLACLGVHLGDNSNLRAPDPNNPEGFWEDKKVKAICEAFMADSGLRWDSLRHLDHAEFSTGIGHQYFTQAVSVVTDAVNSAPNKIWGVKNPRMALMVSFWLSVFASIGCDDRYVVSLRNPLSVAASIIRGSPHRCTGTRPTYLHLVWLAHMIGALTPAMDGKPTVIVDYDAVMARPESELHRMADAIGLGPMCDERALAQYAADFLKPGLRHSAFAAGHLHSDPLVPKIVRDAYSAASEAATEGTGPNSPEFRNRWLKIVEDFGTLAPVLRLADDHELERTQRRALAGAFYRRLPLGIKRMLAGAAARSGH